MSPRPARSKLDDSDIVSRTPRHQVERDVPDVEIPKEFIETNDGLNGISNSPSSSKVSFADVPAVFSFRYYNGSRSNYFLSHLL